MHQHIIKLCLPVACFLFWTAILTSTGFLSASESRQPPRIGDQFYRETTLNYLNLLRETFRLKPKRPPLYKKRVGKEMIKLPKPNYRGILLEEAIVQRRSIRNFSRKAVTLAQLSQMLFAAQGITDRKTFNVPLRAVPSAGALYPFEVYIFAHNVESLQPGIYHYLVLDHAVELLKKGDFRKKITSAGLHQDMLGEAGVTFALAAVFNRTRSKYDERGMRYVFIEAGHISQNISLQAVSLGLGSVAVGAFYDEKLNNLLGLDGETEASIYLHAVGQP